MTGQLELWGPGWDVEPCDTSPTPDPDEQAHTDLHARRPIAPDHGRPAGRPTTRRLFGPVTDVTIRGDLL